MRALRTALVAVVLLAGLVPATAGAADRPYSVTFDWSDPAEGFAGWVFDEQEDDAEIPPRRYAFTRGTGPEGRGLTIVPTGDGGQVYRRTLGRFGYGTPGTVRTRQAIWRDVTARVRERQALRFGLYGGATPLAPIDLIRQEQDVEDGTITRSDPDSDSTFSTQWMFTLPCDVPDPQQPACGPVDPAEGSISFVGGVDLTLVDPEAPTVTASGPAWDARGRWLGRTPASVTLAAQDPGSGVRRYTLRSTGPGGSRTVLDRTVGCDLRNVDDSDGSRQCPVAPGPSTRDAAAIGALPTGTTTFTATARDLAGQAAAPLRWTVKIDRADPRLTTPAVLTRLDGRFVPGDGVLAVPVLATDGQSGVRAITATVRSSRGEETFAVPAPCTDASARCPAIGRGTLRIPLDLLPTGTSTVSLRVTDLAGNTTDGRPVRLRVDRTGPKAPRLSARPSRTQPRSVVWSAVQDPGGSGVDGYEARVRRVDPVTGATLGVPRPFSRVRGGRSVVVPSVLRDSGLVVDVRAVDRSGNAGDVASYVIGAPRIATAAGLLDKLRKYRDLIRDLPGELFPIVGGFVCGEAGVCKPLPGRDTIRWLMGELISGFVVIGDVRDVLVAALRLDFAGGALAIAGLVPFAGDAAKSIAAIRKFVRRTKMPLHDVMEAVARVFGGNSRFTRLVMDGLTSGAYGRLRNGGLSHDGVQQLARRGNDINALSRRAVLARRALSDAEQADVEANLKRYWDSPSGGARAEALGVEASIQYLQRFPNVKILVNGRPGNGLGRNGPDLVAYDEVADRLIVVEAKGTLRADSPLDLDKLVAPVGGQNYVQPSRSWLAAPRTGGNDYLTQLRRKGRTDPDARRAYQELRKVVRGQRRFDAKVVNVRPDREGSQAYGSGLDRATRLIRENGGVDGLDIIDVPYRRQ